MSTQTIVADAYVGCRPVPVWVDDVGLVKVDPDKGSLGAHLFWDVAIPVYPQDQVFYNIYYAQNRFGVFTSEPKLITTALNVVVPLVQPGLPYYFGVRATEFDPTVYDINSLQQVGYNLYQYPESQTLLNDMDAYTLFVQVPSTENFPLNGFLLIDYEVIEYEAIVDGYFIIPEGGRGQILTMPADHSPGGSVYLWKGVEDGNTNIHRGVRDWNADQIPYIPDSYGQFDADMDGYRASPFPSDIITNLYLSDQANANFGYLSQCGYQRATIYDVLSGGIPCGSQDGTGTYTSNDSGIRGASIQNTLLDRLDALLDVTGEPAILLKRNWSGRRCSCISLRREIALSRCPVCAGTGFEKPYTRYYNNRSIAQNIDNTAGYIMVRRSPWQDVQKLEDKQSIRQDVNITAWTLTVPSIHERDLLVLFDPTEQIIDFIYEVTTVTRNSALFGQSASQQLNLFRLDKTDQVYTLREIFE